MKELDLTNLLAGFFKSGLATGLVLIVMLVEALLLVAARKRLPVEVVTAISPGALIVLALHMALKGGHDAWIALLLTAALPAHVLDLRTRGWLGRNR